MVRSVVIAGGGTGGHIEPAMALADELRRADPEISIVCLGTKRGLENRVIPARGYQLELIPPVPLPRKINRELLSVPSRMLGAIRAAGAVIDRAQADVVVGFGGYVSTPAYLAAKQRRVPIVVHEANPRPGLANRIGSRLTRNVFIGQRGTRLPHATLAGIPIRREIASLDRLALTETARLHFGLRPDLPVLLVTGGSQGAASLNRAVLGAAQSILSVGVQVLHIVGPRSGSAVSVPSGEVPYVVIEYLDRMDLAYAAADFALCRAGAMTCAELTAVGMPAAYVPLPHGNGEQRLNALPVERAGGGLIVDDAALSPDWIRNVLLRVLLDHDLVASMSRAAASIGHPNADQALAARVLALADEGHGRRRAARRAGQPAGYGSPAGYGTPPGQSPTYGAAGQAPRYGPAPGQAPADDLAGPSVPYDPAGQPPPYGGSPGYAARPGYDVPPAQSPGYATTPGYDVPPGQAPGYAPTPGYDVSPGYAPTAGYDVPPGRAPGYDATPAQPPGSGTSPDADQDGPQPTARTSRHRGSHRSR
jgi:UDP-N-acetylglucosamine--N-acetylmuramyl-(pentapeptide) pyrophosphoryl-undecaprenol N-acetylglucosamine transferase